MVPVGLVHRPGQVEACQSRHLGENSDEEDRPEREGEAVSFPHLTTTWFYGRPDQRNQNPRYTLKPTYSPVFLPAMFDPHYFDIYIYIFSSLL